MKKMLKYIVVILIIIGWDIWKNVKMFKEKNREINKVLRISKNHKNFTSTFLKIFHLFLGKKW